jgi:mycofactocin system glycosyltransferase
LDAGAIHPRPEREALAATVTVVIPVRDRATQLDRCLRAVGRDVRVVVVDDGSAEANAVSTVCRVHGAMLVRRQRSGGPGAARNAATPHVSTELVAFVDSDCVPDPNWLASLTAHFDDPLVGAVAPRVRPANRDGGSALTRYSEARSPIDMGSREGPVAPGNQVPYVPSAALVVRDSALGSGFDEQLRYGEDVDLIWRLHDAGWRIRYDPRVVVRHSEPRTWREFLTRRWRYGTSAAALGRRHPGRVSHLILSPLPTCASLLMLRRPVAGIAITGLQAALLAHRLGGTGVPARRSVGWGCASTAHTIVGLGRAVTMFAAPALLMALAMRRARAPATVLMLASPVAEYVRRGPRMNPLSWLAACVADDVAYGLGVWRGCLTQRTLSPLRPRGSARAFPLAWRASTGNAARGRRRSWDR